jgi:uncharacterized NAD-dependent epimerase/dehydratase family protein
VREPAIVLANRHFRKINAKTTHGLVRSSLRYEVLGVVDPDCAGEDAGRLLDGRPRGIPIHASVADAIAGAAREPRHCVIGVATAGGVMPPDLRESIVDAIEAGLTVVNGLHQLLSDDPELVALAERHGATLIDGRRPRPTRELRFWSGAIKDVRALRVPVIGTDCATGKRTTCVMLRDACREAGMSAQMIYTGQSGWLQGERYGFILDSTPNDFVCGELERAIVDCDRNESPDVILIEGQSGLRNPSGPCGSELLLSGAASGAVLQHPAGREHFIDSGWKRRLPPVETEVALIRMYGVEVWAVTLNETGLTPEAAAQARDDLRAKLDLPVVLPFTDGVGEVVEAIRARVEGRKG